MIETENKFKDGDKVTCCIQGIFIEDGVISIEKDRGSYNYGRPFICQNYKNGDNATDKKGYKYSWVLKDDFTQTDVTDLKLKEEKITPVHMIDPKVGCSIDPASREYVDTTAAWMGYWGLVDKAMRDSYTMSTGSTIEPVFTPPKKRVNFFID